MDNSFNNWNNHAGRDVNIQINQDRPEKVATYEPEPIWRSPITMAVLSWLGFFSSLGSIFSLFKVFEPVLRWFNNSKKEMTIGVNQSYTFIFIGILLVTIIIFSLRTITSRQTRHPLIFNYALSGVGKRLTLEKINVNNCPICNGKMKYYNKPIAWDIVRDSNGKENRIVTERVPALECKRNSKHWAEVDPAEDEV